MFTTTVPWLIVLSVLAILITLFDRSIIKQIPIFPLSFKIFRLISLIIMWAGVFVLWSMHILFF